MQSFEYRRPASVAEAVRALGADPGSRALAGGQSMLAAMKLGLSAPSGIVDLSQVPGLRTLRIDGERLVIGAMATHAAVAASAEARHLIPSIAALAGGIADRAVRTMGTLGGSLANADPAACWPAGVLALGATIHTDRRAIAADDFFRSLYETALAPDELIVSVSFPRPERAAYVKFKHPASRFALVGVCVARGPMGLRVAVTGAGPTVFRATAVEQALAAEFTPASAERATVSPEGLNTDMHGSAEYRAHLIPVLAARAMAAAR
jgi:carbon-monoxide dehydrogenase medium subunit